MTTHPAASLFPMLDGEAFAALKADIAEHGQRVPIAMYGGAVLDGRNRLRACLELGLEPVTVDVPLEVDPWTYVVSLNLRRRHLAPHEAGRIYRELLERRGVKRGSGARNDRTSDTVSEVAEQLGVNERTMRRHLAAADAYDGLPEALKAEVDDGLPLATATKILSGGRSGPPVQTAGGVSISDDYHTPADLLELVYDFFGEVDLDPCSNAKGEAANVKAAQHYTAEDDGLALPWKGRVFCNPPYGRALPDWTAKAVDAWMDGASILLLVPANMSTNWMRRLDTFPRGFVHGRVRFRPGGEDGLATFHSAIFALLQDEPMQEPLFHEVFRRAGPTWSGCVEQMAGHDMAREVER